MLQTFAGIAFTPSVKAEQDRRGSRASYARYESGAVPDEVLGAEEIDFIQSRDSFYIATVGETGWPYVQHRGGPVGFLRVLDEHTIGYAEFRGNRQYVSLGNLSVNDRVSLILMDYPGRQRLKIMGHATKLDAGKDSTVLELLEDSTYRARVDGAVVIRVVAFDWNCPQHIAPRYTVEELNTLRDTGGK